MKLLYTLIILFAFSFADDVYPNFADINKQFRFEEKRIYTREVNEKEMKISGGSFDFLGEQINIPITTSYSYIYKFEILQNNQVLNEIDFLNKVGLDVEANEIVNRYGNKLTEYYKKYPNAPSSEKERRSINLREGLKFLIVYAVGGLAAYKADKDDIPSLKVIPAFGIIWTIFAIKRGINRDKGANSRPTLRQTLSSEQITSLAKAYNQKIYKEIQAQP
jgi:hypothetical protein